MPISSPLAIPDDLTIVCGISSQTSQRELTELLDEGVGEVFAGYVTPKWLQRYGLEVSPNRRYFLERQIADRETLRTIGARVRASGAKLVITLNEHYYAPGPRRLLWEIVEDAISAGATGFIVADLDLLDEMSRRLGSDVELIVSTEAGVFNVDIASLFIDHGARRIVFPREMKLREMEAIVGGVSSAAVDFEAFVVREYCVNSSACCVVTHGYARREHFCACHTGRTIWDARERKSIAPPVKPEAWSTDPAFLDATLSLSRCGFCALERLIGMGVRYLKVPGRSASALRAVRKLKQLLEAGDLSAEACRELVGSAEFCDSGHYCYYSNEKERRHPAGMRASRSLGPDKAAKTAACRQDAGAPFEPTDPDLAVYLPWGKHRSGIAKSLSTRGLAAVIDSPLFAADWEMRTAERTLKRLQSLGVDPSRVPERVYLGIEHCGLRLPSVRALVDDVRRFRDSGYPVSLVAPIAFQTIRNQLVTLLDAVIASSDDSDLELVINDFGLLDLATRRWPCNRVLGRLANQMKRQQLVDDPTLRPDPRALGLDDDTLSTASSEHLEALSHEQARCFGYPYLSSPFFRQLLVERGVSRIETDVLPTPLSSELADDLSHSVYLPWTYLTTTRACHLAITIEGAVRSYPTERCEQSCGRYLILPEYAWPHRRIVQRGTSTFMDCADDVLPFVESMAGRMSRIVFQPFVPY